MELVADNTVVPDPMAESEAAATLAEFHRSVAADLPANSETRALALRCAGRWDRIAGAKARASRLKVVS